MEMKYLFAAPNFEKRFAFEHVRINALNSFDARKKTLLTGEMLDKIKRVLGEEEYLKFVELSKKVTYAELQTLFEELIKKRCVQKVC